MREQARKAGRFVSNHMTEVLCVMLCTVLVGVISAGITARESLRVATVRNEEKIEAFCNWQELSYGRLVDQIDRLEGMSQVMDALLGKKIDDLKERLDQRCDTLENHLLDLVKKARYEDTGG